MIATKQVHYLAARLRPLGRSRRSEHLFSYVSKGGAAKSAKGGAAKSAITHLACAIALLFVARRLLTSGALLRSLPRPFREHQTALFAGALCLLQNENVWLRIKCDIYAAKCDIYVHTFTSPRWARRANTSGLLRQSAAIFSSSNCIAPSCLLSSLRLPFPFSLPSLCSFGVRV